MTHTPHRTKDQYLTQLEHKVKTGFGDAWHTLSKVQKIHALRRAREALQGGEESAVSPEVKMAEIKELVAKTTEQRAAARALMDQTVPMRLESVQAVAHQLTSLDQYEFVVATASGQRVLLSAGELLTKIERFNSTELKSLQRAVDYLSDAGDPDLAASMSIHKLRRYAETIDNRYTQVARHLDMLKESAGRRVDGAEKMFNDTAVKTWCKQNPDAASQALDSALQGVDAGLTVAKEFAGQFKGVVIAIQTLKASVVDRQIKAADAKRMVKKQGKEHTADFGMQIVAKNPAIYAMRIAQKQKADFKELLGGLGFVGEWIPLGIWTLVADRLQKAADTYFEQPVKDLEEKLGISRKDEEVSEQIKSQAETLAKGILDKAMEKASTKTFEEILHNAASGVPAVVIGSTVGAAVDWAIAKIVKEFPNDPAQPVDAEGLKGSVGSLRQALEMNRAKYGLSEEVEATKLQSPDRPTETADGRKVIRILQSDLENDSGGPFHWVEIEDPAEGTLTGKLRYSKKPEERIFRAVSSLATSEMFPTEDKYGNKIDEVYHKAVKDGVNVGLEVREGDLRGLLDMNKVFTPQRPAKVDDWSGRTVDVHEVRDASGVGPGDKGEWYRLKDQKYMYFEHESGAREWAELESTDATGMKFVEKFRNNKLTTVVIRDLTPYRG